MEAENLYILSVSLGGICRAHHNSRIQHTEKIINKSLTELSIK